jgi:hypothetical protein
MASKQQAINDAQIRANLAKCEHVVFGYVDVLTMWYNYTPLELWDRRRHKQPVVTEVIRVKPNTTDTI